jgi:hypothetical protein
MILFIILLRLKIKIKIKINRNASLSESIVHRVSLFMYPFNNVNAILPSMMQKYLITTAWGSSSCEWFHYVAINFFSSSKTYFSFSSYDFYYFIIIFLLRLFRKLVFAFIKKCNTSNTKARVQKIISAVEIKL